MVIFVACMSNHNKDGTTSIMQGLIHIFAWFKRHGVKVMKASIDIKNKTQTRKGKTLFYSILF